MPVVHIYMFPGKTKDQKNQLVKRKIANIKPESLNILFHDTAKEDWGMCGSLASKQMPLTNQVSSGDMQEAKWHR